MPKEAKESVNESTVKEPTLAAQDLPLPVETTKIIVTPAPKVVAIRHVQRTLAAMTRPDGAVGADDLNKYLGQWFELGWTLFSVHTLGVAPEGTNLLYILVQYA